MSLLSSKCYPTLAVPTTFCFSNMKVLGTITAFKTNQNIYIAPKELSRFLFFLFLDISSAVVEHISNGGDGMLMCSSSKTSWGLFASNSPYDGTTRYKVLDLFLHKRVGVVQSLTVILHLVVNLFSGNCCYTKRIIIFTMLCGTKTVASFDEQVFDAAFNLV